MPRVSWVLRLITAKKMEQEASIVALAEMDPANDDEYAEAMKRAQMPSPYYLH